jgi:hypothetical protein
MSGGVLVAFAVTVHLVWFAGALPVQGRERAHASMRWWAPLVWAFVHYAWPGVAGLGVAYVVGASGLGFFLHALCGVGAVCLVVAAVACLSHVGAALTMRPPWPQGSALASDFAGYKSLRMWVGLLATMALNGLAVEGSGRLLEWTGKGAAPTVRAYQPLLETLARKPDPAADLRGFTRATLADIAQAVHEHRSLNVPAAPGALPKVDAAQGALARLPRPPMGDRATARALGVQASQLAARRAAWSEVADAYARAHAADRRDPLILAELASAQMRAGQPARALDSLVEALRLDPRFSGAWMLLAELRLRNSSGEPRQVQEAARYYLVAFWFTRDRPALIKRYRAKLKPGPEDPPHTAAAFQIALQRLTP